MIPLSGVRSSWLNVAMKVFLTSLASRLARRAWVSAAVRSAIFVSRSESLSSKERRVASTSDGMGGSVHGTPVGNESEAGCGFASALGISFRITGSTEGAVFTQKET
jgi:hypothetical protein